MASDIENKRRSLERIIVSNRRYERIIEWLEKQRQSELEGLSAANIYLDKAEQARQQWLEGDRERQAEKNNLPRNHGEKFELIKFDVTPFRPTIEWAKQELDATVNRAFSEGRISGRFIKQLKAGLAKAIGHGEPTEFLEELEVSRQAMALALEHPEAQRAEKLSACFTPTSETAFSETIAQIINKILAAHDARQHTIHDLATYFTMQNRYFDTMSRGLHEETEEDRPQYVADTVSMSQHGLTMEFAQRYCDKLNFAYQAGFNAGMNNSPLNYAENPFSFFQENARRPVPGCGRLLNENELRERERSFKQI